MITKHQFFCMILLFEVGTTTMFALGIKSKQDAWLAVAVSTVFGLLLVLMYIALQKRYPGKGIGEIILEICGPVVGIPLVILYTLYFSYSSSVNLRDFCDLISLTQLEFTPLPVIVGLILIPVLYNLISGERAFAKTAEIFFPLYIFSLAAVIILVLLSGIFHPDFLLPVLPDGVKGLFTGDIVRIVEAPYGEMIAFLALWKFADKPSSYVKASISGVLFTGLIEVVLSIFIVCTLGADFALFATIPLFKVIQLINIENIVTNLDVMGVLLILIGGYKIVVFFFAAVLTLQSILKINRKIIIFAVGTLITVNALLIKGYIQHIWAANFIRIPYIHGLFQIAIPAVLFIAGLLKPPEGKMREPVRDKGAGA